MLVCLRQASSTRGCSGIRRSSDALHPASPMKEHVNKAGSIVQDMNNMKGAGSEWQRIAIERITPELREMASNLQATIEHLNQNQSRVHMPPYKDYATANADLAANLAETISDFSNYAQSKGKFEDLGRKIELSPDR
jgi:hypothetical protein